jgi:hypothetical protein
MKISELIETLATISKERGDLDVVTVADGKGYRYNLVCYNPTVGIYEAHRFQPVDGYYPEEKPNAICIN